MRLYFRRGIHTEFTGAARVSGSDILTPKEPSFLLYRPYTAVPQLTSEASENYFLFYAEWTHIEEILFSLIPAFLSDIPPATIYPRNQWGHPKQFCFCAVVVAISFLEASTAKWVKKDRACLTRLVEVSTYTWLVLDNQLEIEIVAICISVFLRDAFVRRVHSARLFAEVIYETPESMGIQFISGKPSFHRSSVNSTTCSSPISSIPSEPRQSTM